MCVHDVFVALGTDYKATGAEKRSWIVVETEEIPRLAAARTTHFFLSTTLAVQNINAPANNTDDVR